MLFLYIGVLVKASREKCNPTCLQSRINKHDGMNLLVDAHTFFFLRPAAVYAPDTHERERKCIIVNGSRSSIQLAGLVLQANFLSEKKGVNQFFFRKKKCIFDKTSPGINAALQHVLLLFLSSTSLSLQRGERVRI